MDIDFSLVEELKKVMFDAYEEVKQLDKNIKNKELHDIVTDADIYMETKIINKIKELFPSHAIFSEEIGEISGDSEYVWYLDPIDGTINFAAGIPLFSTSIALRKNDETIFGLVIDYSRRDVYHAFKGKGAYCNGNKMIVSNNDKLENCIFTICLTSHYNEEHTKKVLSVIEKLSPKIRGGAMYCFNCN